MTDGLRAATQSPHPGYSCSCLAAVGLEVGSQSCPPLCLSEKGGLSQGITADPVSGHLGVPLFSLESAL